MVEILDVESNLGDDKEVIAGNNIYLKKINK